MPKTQHPFERRAFLRALPLLPFSTRPFSALSKASLPAAALPAGALPSGALPSAATLAGRSSVQSARQATVVPFLGRVNPKPGELVGSGLDRRLTFDLTRLQADHGTVSNRDFFVRTGSPDGLEARKGKLDEWIVLFSAGEDASGHFRDFGGPDTEITVSSLRERAKPMGQHLLECSGNSGARGFGLLSMAEWSGVPLRQLCSETLSNVHRGTFILVTGNDDHSAPSLSSTQGASWIFSLDQVKDAGAFLATGMNGEPLPLDHGGPVRLIMPGWYGCSNIKWVESVKVVRQEHPSTSQMREFASRTHQEGQPELARDYLPAEIDFAAMPVSVVGPDQAGRYVIHGVAWGNPAGVKTIVVRYQYNNGDTVELTVADFVAQEPSSWTTWSQQFEPKIKGPVEITVRVGETDVRTRRLDKAYYSRSVEL